MKTLINVGLAALVIALASPPLIGTLGAHAVDSVNSARELYAAAEYEEALTVLSRLQDSGGIDDSRSAAEVRAYCLLALGRADAAGQAITEIVSSDPLFRPSGSDASPRVRAAFSEIRRRMLPDMIQSHYAMAKARFDARDFVGARDGFSATLKMLADDDAAEAARQSPLSDVRTLAVGFRELSVSAIPPDPIATRVQPVAAVAPLMAVPPRVYTSQDTQVAPPVAVRQPVPVFRLQGAPPAPGSIEVLINEEGAVEQAIIRSTISPRYDQQLLTAARDWAFSPALLDGNPVKYRKLMHIAVK